MELSRPVVVQRHSYFPIRPIWACPWAKNLSNEAALGPNCGTHISEIAGWIYTIRSFMELSRPVVVQHHCHFTLTLDVQGQILKMLYLRNGRADWDGAKAMWVDRILDPGSPTLWLWTLIFKVKFRKSPNSGMGCPIDMEWKGCESIRC